MPLWGPTCRPAGAEEMQPMTKRATRPLRKRAAPHAGAKATNPAKAANAARAKTAVRDLERVDDMSPAVGSNLKRLRADRGLSLEQLASVSGVSRAMLGQIELGKSTPTIRTLWKISLALDVPFSALLGGAVGTGTTVLRAGETRRFVNKDETFVSRALFPMGGPRRTEFYELRVHGHTDESAPAHPKGTVETLTVSQGTLEVEVRGEVTHLGVGDVLVFDADAPHHYRNRASGVAVVYLVMTYA